MKQNDLLNLETDDSCAICGNRGMQILTKHHIDGNWSNNTYENLIVLCHNCHHKIINKKGLRKSQIIDRKRNLIHRIITTYGLNALKIAKRNKSGVIAMPFLLYHLVDLVYMTQQEAQMGYGKQADATALFAITKKGKNLVGKWFV